LDDAVAGGADDESATTMFVFVLCLCCVCVVYVLCLCWFSLFYLFYISI
jgi:hypothetical protein